MSDTIEGLSGNQPWGWLIIAFTTVIAFFAVVNLARWSTHRQKVGTLIDTQQGKRVVADGVIVLLGLFFVYLGLFVY